LIGAVMSYNFATLYWQNPLTKEPEFLFAKKDGKGSLVSFFYHETIQFAQKVYGDLLGLVGPFSQWSKIIANMPFPHQKVQVGPSKVYYINVNYNPHLIKALNQFKRYLDGCHSNGTINQFCTKYPYSVYKDYQIYTVSQVESMITQKLFGSKDLEALANFAKIRPVLKTNLNPLTFEPTQAQIQSAEFIFKHLKGKKQMATYIQTLKKRSSEYFKSLKPIYQESVKYYTGQGFNTMNGYLRGTYQPSCDAELKDLHTDIVNLNLVLSNAPALEQEIIVYRGFNFDTIPKFHQLKAGQVLDIFRDSFNSTSFSANIASGFAGQKCCIFALHLPPGTKGLYVGEHSTYEKENEFILAPGPLFRVMKFKPDSIISKEVKELQGFKYYYLFCVDCEQAYQKYNYLTYYQLVGPTLAVAKTPTKGQYPSPKYESLDVEGLIVPHKPSYLTKTKDDQLITKALVKHAKYDETIPIQIGKKNADLLWDVDQHFIITDDEMKLIKSLLTHVTSQHFEPIDFYLAIDQLNMEQRKPILTNFDIIYVLNGSEINNTIVYTKRAKLLTNTATISWVIWELSGQSLPDDHIWLPKHYIAVTEDDIFDLYDNYPIKSTKGSLVSMNKLELNSDPHFDQSAKKDHIDYYEMFTEGKLIPMTPKYHLFYDYEIDNYIILYSGDAKQSKAEVFDLIKSYLKSGWFEGKVAIPTKKIPIKYKNIPLSTKKIPVSTKKIPLSVKSSIDEKYLKGLSASLIEKLHHWSQGCPPNKFRNPKTGICVGIEGKIGKKLLQDLTTESTSLPQTNNIDTQYLKGLDQKVVDQILILSVGCQKNMIKNPKTGNCVLIGGLVAKKVIKDLTSNY
jgi:hypothetical protein